MHSIIIVLFIVFCTTKFITLSDENEKKKSLAINLKSAFFVIAAALSMTKMGKTIYFLFAIAIIVAFTLKQKTSVF